MPAAPPPSFAIVRLLFERHLRDHASLPESARLRDLGAEESLLRDYSGRVIFELLQNAVDRARTQIVIVLLSADGGRLIVGNDGAAVSAAERSGRLGTMAPKGASDFHALLSLHSSTKLARESVGNKGVGFRSVFASSDQVEVWSRCAEGGFWGLGLTHPGRVLTQEADWSENRTASFYGPSLEQPIAAAELAVRLGLADALAAQVAHLATLVVLPQLRPKDIVEVRETLRQLGEVPLRFLNKRRARWAESATSLRLTLFDQDAGSAEQVRDTALEPGWVEIEVPPVPMDAETRGKTGLDLDRAEVMLLLPPERKNENSLAARPLYFSYLPTEQQAGFGVHIHGDFYLDNSRRGVTFRMAGAGDSSPQAHNGRLLVAAAHAIVEDLWCRADVSQRQDFFRLATPAACECPHLRREVAQLLLGSEETFARLVRQAFAGATRTPQALAERAKDFFEAVDRWAYCAYKDLKRGQYGKWRQELLRWTGRSSAAVLPVETPTAAPVSVGVAIPLPMEPARVYFRKEDGDPLPAVIAEQQVWVTRFDASPCADDLSKHFRLQDFSRVDLLAGLRPGGEARQHEQLLLAALQLATETQAHGGLGSILERCRREPGGPAWRLRGLKDGKPRELLKVGAALSALHVPVLGGGFHPAGTTTAPPQEALAALGDQPWPWPILDAARMALLLPTGAALEDACLLLGICQGPLLSGQDEVALDRWEELQAGAAPLRRGLAIAALLTWEKHIGAFLGDGGAERPWAGDLTRSLERTAWIPVTLPGIAGRIDQPTDSNTEFVAPRDLWLQLIVGGFRAVQHFLPVLMVNSYREKPKWAQQLGVAAIGEDAAPERLIDALRRLHTMPVRLQHARALEDVYVRLVRALPTETQQDIPILVRQRGGPARWLAEGEKAWFDDGEYTAHLIAFPAAAIWVVRREKAELATRRGLLPFRPKLTAGHAGDSDPAQSAALLRRLNRALPDLFAAAHLARVRTTFEPERVAERADMLSIEHYGKVWIDVEFDGHRQRMGFDSPGDVFLLPGLPPRLLFDGAAKDLRLTDASVQLSEALCQSRAFADSFARALAAWDQAAGEDDVPGPVGRLRHDLGVSDDDIDHWRRTIAESRLSSETREQWVDQVRQALVTFGEVDSSKLHLGSEVTAATWQSVSMPMATEEQIRNQLRATLSGSALEAHVPIVNIAASHRVSLAQAQRLDALYPLLADHFAGLPQEKWTEQRREELLARLQAESLTTAETEALRCLGCRADALLRKRLGLIEASLDPTSLNATQRELAMNFVKGHLLINRLPSAEPSVASSPWHTTVNVDRSLHPLGEDEYLQRARRSARGGRVGEEAVLRAALAEAKQWIRSDQAGFFSALREALRLVASQDDIAKHAKTVDAVGEPGLENLLHISKVWGNAGFDVLVPDFAAKKFKLVEVKRVASLSFVELFLSENERARALHYRAGGVPWHLWVVASDGQLSDVTTVIEQFAKTRSAIDKILLAGIRPEEYRLRISVGGPGREPILPE